MVVILEFELMKYDECYFARIGTSALYLITKLSNGMLVSAEISSDLPLQQMAEGLSKPD